MSERENSNHESKMSSKSDINLENDFYLNLFNNLISAFAYHKIIYNNNDEAIDYEFLMANQAFEKYIGLKSSDFLGKRLTQIITNITSDSTDWISIYNKVAETGENIEFESYSEALERIYIIRAYSFEKGYFATVFEDITEKKIKDTILIARSKILEYSLNKTSREIMQYTLDVIEEATGSNIGFYHFFDDDEKVISLQVWSSNTLQNMCTAEGAGTRYETAKAGVWVDCVNERKPVIHNNYEELKHKKGMPKGHAPIIRELLIPIFRNKKIVGILGVGNKKTNYNNLDIKIAQEIADISWEVNILKLKEEELKAKNEEYVAANEQLNEKNVEFEILNEKLKEKNDEYVRINEELKERSEEYYSLNEELTAEVKRRREGEEQYKSLFENTGTITCVVNKDKIITKVNNKFYSVLGYTPEEIENKYSFVNFLHKDDIQFMVKYHEERRKNPDLVPKQYEFRIVDKSGKIRHMYINVEIIPGTSDSLASLIDITDLKEVESSLKASEEKFQKAFKTSPYAITIFDVESGKLIEANEEFYKLSGYTPDDLINNFSLHLNLWDNLKDREQVGFDLLNKIPVYNREYKFRNKNGDLIYGLYSAQIVQVDNKLLVLASINDITERKRISEEINEKNLQLSYKNKELEQFAYVATHDMRSPILNIKGLLDVIDYENLCNPENQIVLEKINNSANRLYDTLHDLISVIAYEKTLDMKTIIISFENITKSILSNLEILINNAEAEILTDFTKAPEITYIKGHITSALQNLISNSLKYRDKKRKLLIEISTEKVQDYILLKVKDNGIGIKKEYHEKIFELFKRISTDVDGKGIGLFITKSQIESKGGKIEIESEFGIGTTFNIYLKNLI